MAYLVFAPSFVLSFGVAVWMFLCRRRDRVEFNIASAGRGTLRRVRERGEELRPEDVNTLLFIHSQAEGLLENFDHLRKIGFFNYDRWEDFEVSEQESTAKGLDFVLDLGGLISTLTHDNDVVREAGYELAVAIAIALFAYTPFSTFRVAWLLLKIFAKVGGEWSQERIADVFSGPSRHFASRRLRPRR